MTYTKQNHASQGHAPQRHSQPTQHATQPSDSAQHAAQSSDSAQLHVTQQDFTQLNLHPNILKAIEKCGYKHPTPVQLKAIPVISSGKDVVISAPTGTGKTAAYVLPALQLLNNHPSSGKARVLILAPTRELATQITNVITKYAKFTQVSVVSLIGGMAYFKQKKKLAGKVDIIVATPGRLIDYMENHRLDLSYIEMLVIDEADRMLDMGFIKDIKKIVAVTAKTRQTLLLSATASDALMSVLQHLLKHPVRIDLEQGKTTEPLIQQQLYLADDGTHKKALLQHFLANTNIFKAIIFSATKRNAKRMVMDLDKAGYSVAALHGDLKQGQRNRTLAQFREGKVQFLIATDVAARGIDVFDITHIINYDLPKVYEDYVHRIGRTGRAGKTGTAISLVLSAEYRLLNGIERYIGKKLARMTVEGLEPTIKEKPQHEGENAHARPRPHSRPHSRPHGRRRGHGGKAAHAHAHTKSSHSNGRRKNSSK
jgi:superfamily II DNA/RNA helicase